MENYFSLNMDISQINAISNLGLAHIGDGVFELLCRSYLCKKGGKRVQNLHKNTVAMVKASSQAEFASLLLPHLAEEEQDWYRRGKNAHSHAAPKSATKQEYAKATGLETLFGALYLAGRLDRLNELFHLLVAEEQPE
ncbi:MAG: ribonuclease III [Ruminococcaceae bacterium]|nr:ribonuclease III [Oscillospiraceae bacterium]